MTTAAETIPQQSAPEGQEGPRTPLEGPQAPPVDPAAPYGRTPGGRPRKTPLTGKRGRPKGSGTGRRQQQRTSVIGAAGGTRKTKAPTDYRPVIMRTAQMLLMPLSFRAPVDAYTITMHLAGEDTRQNPGMARAISNCAQEYPQVAAALDKLAVVGGPVSDVLACGFALAVQLAVNHRRLPLAVGTRLGAVDPADIAAALQEQGEQIAAEAA